MMRMIGLTGIGCAAALLAGAAGAAEQAPKELMTPNVRVAEATGLPVPDHGNNDPSNIIRHDGLYYCWYTEYLPKIDAFKNTQIRLITSPDGVAWTERGVAMAPDGTNDFDALGALTACVVEHEGRFYMFYSAVPKGFNGARKDGNHVGIALAEADDPMGPWKKKGLVLDVSKDGWDRQHVDDANVVRYKGQWLLYYKGFRKHEGPNDTRIGLATARELTGPYSRYAGNPIFKGHCVSAWKHRDGLAMVTGSNGKQVVFWSTDGVTFVPAGPFKNRSTGFYVPEGNFIEGPNNQGVTWGMDITGFPTAPGKARLFRFECDLGIANPPDNGDGTVKSF